MKKLKSRALNEFLQDEEHALSVLVGVPTAINVIGFVVAVLAIVFMR